MDKKTQIILPKTFEMFSAMQFNSKPNYLYCEYKYINAWLPTRPHLWSCFPIFFLQNMFSKAFNVTGDGIAALTTSNDQNP